MAVSVRTIRTAVPATVIRQQQVRDLFAAQPGLGRLGERLVATSFDASGIDTRHTVVSDFEEGGHGAFIDAERTLLTPGTAARNGLYTVEAAELAVRAAREALDDGSGFGAADVTHVITVSCTGFFSPGPDYVLVRRLGLDPGVQRFHVGFMGCYAAFPALKMAKAFCEADPSAVVLVVSVELCTLHVRSSSDPDQIVASSVFADGAAAALVTAREPADAAAGPRAVLDLDSFSTTLTPVGEDAMAWTIGDHGFEMVLSSYVPKIIDEHITGALQPLLAGTSSTAVERWAVHPGGRSILDRVQTKLGLSDEQLAPSRDVLRRYGNMSSATILFVLERILADAAAPVAGGERVCAMAFGPGLTVETGLFTARPGSAARLAAGDEAGHEAGLAVGEAA
ncbi:type III polyketide synthase [Herbiconiux sp. CPCC 203407]|uniref:Type III polyketide synthase n=1 Tax=Herbiconiux oxytropis TaxID=2970915 RepID=A0AA42BT85_9MICO|nr:type III polyketide synthase [Herbiconiux oxytropis]MCS5720552.1 type III polyketide synthase [Herbiconiux oxytropis]MCS5726125.1 type III polyketide synthase [Herbiconiux oxytropis]